MTRRVRSETRPSYLSHPATPAHESENETIRQAIAILGARGQAKRGPAFATPDDAGQYAALTLGDAPREHFLCMFLDTRHRLIAAEVLFSGTIDGSEVHPREVALRSLHHNAAAVIFAHNHPSGSLEASPADRAVTARLKMALQLLEIRTLDHFICAEGKYSSMAKQGLI